MDDNCKDCLLVKALDERVEKMESKCTDHAGRIGVLEKAVAVSDEKFKQVFEKLDKIIAILDKNSDRLPNFVWGIAGAVGAGLLLWFMKG